MSLRLFKSQFRVDDITRLCQNFKILRKRFHKLIIHFKIPYTCYFHVSINIGTWNTNLNLFDPVLLLMTSPRGVKSSKFWDIGFKNEYFTSNISSLLIFIFLSRIYHYISRKWSQKQTPLFKVSWKIDFDLFITLDKRYTTLGSFYPIWR